MFCHFIQNYHIFVYYRLTWITHFAILAQIRIKQVCTFWKKELPLCFFTEARVWESETIIVNGDHVFFITGSGLNKMNCELMLTYDTPAYMFNVYKNQLSQQTGSRNLTGPKTLPTIWHTYMKLVTKYQISAINSCWEKCDENILDGRGGRTEVKQCTPPPVEWEYNQKSTNIICTCIGTHKHNFYLWFPR